MSGADRRSGLALLLRRWTGGQQWQPVGAVGVAQAACRGEASTAAGVAPRRARKEVNAMRKSSSSKVTSPKVAAKASKALQDGRSSARTRSIAGSALAQARGGKRGK
jgi:hypothetical protein